MKSFFAACCGLALMVAPLAARAEDPSPAPAMPGQMMAIDCANAHAQMTALMAPPSPAPDASTDTDKTYVAAMNTMVEHVAMMSKIEMKCGKNPKAMAAAHKMVNDSQDQFQMFFGIPYGP